jgi:hypothetical protein
MAGNNPNTMLPSTGTNYEAYNQQSNAQPFTTQILAESILASGIPTQTAMLGIRRPADANGNVAISNAFENDALESGQVTVLTGLSTTTTTPAWKSGSTNFSVVGKLTAGSATVAIQGSDDPVALTNPTAAVWFTESSLSLSGAGDVKSQVLTGAYAYYRLNISALTTGPLDLYRGI